MSINKPVLAVKYEQPDEDMKALIKTKMSQIWKGNPSRQRYPDNVEQGPWSVVMPCENPIKPIKDWHNMVFAPVCHRVQN